MKNLFLLTTLLSFLGTLNVDKTNETHSFFYEFAGEIVITTIVVAAFIIKAVKYCIENRAYTYYLIFINIFKLNLKITRNKKDIENVKKKIADTQQKLHDKNNIGHEIRTIANDNIGLWEKQVLLHQKIVNACHLKISSLERNRNELGMLKYLIIKMKSEPNAKNKVEKLESLIKKINKNVSPRIDKQIRKMIQELKTETRKDNIIQLNDRIVNFEVKTG